MRLTNLPAIFEPARPVLQQIEQAGFEAYFVGGCVRDTILGDHIHDIDIATSAYPSEIKQIFKRTVDTGIEHGTVMILDHGKGYETTTFRTESGYQDFRRPDKVTFVRSLSEDLKRRDFTINALAMKENGEVIDLFDGLNDLKKHLIQAVGDPEARFHEDALRMMRAVRFASKLDFDIDPQTLQGVKDNASLLRKIAVERTQVEMEKLLLGQNPPRGLHAMITTGLYQYCPELQGQVEGLQRLANCKQWPLTSNVAAWSALLYALDISAADSAHFLRQWKLSNDLMSAVKSVLVFLGQAKNGAVDAWALFQCGKNNLQAAAEVATLFAFTQEQVQEWQNAYANLAIHDRHELAVNGGQLIQKTSLKPGPAMGKVLNQALRAVVAGEVANSLPALLNYSEQLINQGDL